MTRLRAAVVGTGFIGPVHVEAIRRLGHEVVGILGSSHEKSITACQQLGLRKPYANLAEITQDTDIDVVHLASPNRHHFEQCQAVIAAGKHVICEKPLAMTTAETKTLVELARRSNLVTAVNYNVRFYPMILDARSRFRRGELGRVLHVTGSYLQDWLLEPTDFNWRVMSEHGGALRAVADIGTHWLDTVCFVGDLQVKAVCADLQTVHTTRQKPRGGSETFTGSAKIDRPSDSVPIDTEDAASILIEFTNGARGCFTVSQVMAGRKNCLRFDMGCSKSSIGWDSEEPNMLDVRHRHRPNERVTRDPGSLGACGYSDYPAGHAEGFPDTFKMLYRAVYADIINCQKGVHNSEHLYATFDDGDNEVRICEAILESHHCRGWVEVT